VSFLSRKDEVARRLSSLPPLSPSFFRLLFHYETRRRKSTPPLPFPPFLFSFFFDRLHLTGVYFQILSCLSFSRQENIAANARRTRPASLFPPFSSLPDHANIERTRSGPLSIFPSPFPLLFLLLLLSARRRACFEYLKAVGCPPFPFPSGGESRESTIARSLSHFSLPFFFYPKK